MEQGDDTIREENQHLREENRRLRVEVERLQSAVAQMREDHKRFRESCHTYEVQLRRNLDVMTDSRDRAHRRLLELRELLKPVAAVADTVRAALQRS